MTTEPDEMDEHAVDEFDCGTSIVVMTDGSLRLRFPLMPPSWNCADGAFEAFEDRLSEVLGVEVLSLDKELFGIETPAPDTIERLKAHLIALRREVEVT